MKEAAFRKTIRDYYIKHGRHAMKWRHTTDPYRIVVSEVMLQQTQVDRVALKYPEFIQQFPTFASLAKASVADVLGAWQGLGYNRRALNLKKLAEIVVKKYKGKLPQDPVLLDELPGIGQATACSIAAFAFNEPVVFIETNIRRVYIHFFFSNKKNVHDNDILELVEQTLDKNNSREWYWALMDYGSLLASTVKNPNRKSAHYSKQPKFEGSLRQVRGVILKLLVHDKKRTVASIVKQTAKSKEHVIEALASLEKDGFIIRRGNVFMLK